MFDKTNVIYPFKVGNLLNIFLIDGRGLIVSGTFPKKYFLGNGVTLPEAVHKFLIRKKLSLACAESCTGGGVASAITDIPGSSQWFHTGFVTYANQSKQQLLGVDLEILSQQGAVSKAVVERMALGALKASDANIAVAVSGVAGPGGGSEDKPVGLVWFCWVKSGSNENVIVESQSFQFDGDRSEIRFAAIQQALLGLIAILKK